MKRHWWPGPALDMPTARPGHARAACGQNVPTQLLTRYTYRVNCTRCHRAQTYRAAAVERRLKGTTCPRCGGAGHVAPGGGPLPDPLGGSLRCTTCDGSGALVPCGECGGNWQKPAGCVCHGTGLEPL